MGLTAFSVFGIVVTLFIAGTILWVYAIIDCAMNEPSDSNDKIVWILIIVFTHTLGAIIYLLVRRPERTRERWQ